MLARRLLGRRSLCHSRLLSWYNRGEAAEASAPVQHSTPQHKVTLIPGDGVWPDLMATVRQLLTHLGAPITFDEMPLSEIQPYASAKYDDVISSIRENKVCLKGILASPAGHPKGELYTYNLRMRKDLDLFANVVHIKSLKGLSTRHNDLDFFIIREQIEGEYSCLEHQSVPGVVESMKVITYKNSMQIAKFAFDYAVRQERKTITAVHKANIMKLADGLFLQCCGDVAKLYAKINFNNMIIDNCCMQLTSNPYQFDVMVMPNLYGNIIDNLGAGLVGGAGVVPGESYSHDLAVFEPGARHSFAAAAGRDIANPTGVLLAAANMLTHLHLKELGHVLRTAVEKVIETGEVRTPDIGGQGTTTLFADAVRREIDNLAGLR